MEAIPPEVLRYADFGKTTPLTSPFSSAERAILDAINQKIGARESLADVIDYLATATRDISPCDRVSVAFLEEPGQRIISHYTRAFYEPVILQKGYAEDIAGSSLRTVLARGTPRIINDLEQYHVLRPDSRSTRILLREGVRSSMTCPLRVDDRIVGLLFRSARQLKAYDDHQVLLHLAVAEHLSQIVEKTYRIEQLAEANRAYFEMLGFVTHELKSPLGSMLTDANLILDGYLGDVAPPQRDRIDRMVNKGHYLLGLIGDYLNLARVETGQFQADLHSDVDFVGDIVATAIDIVAPQLEAKNMRLTRHIAPDLPPAQLDPQLVKIVLVNLLGNAAKYGQAGGEIRITVKHDGSRLTVSVWNEGEGFPDSERPRLFRRFSRLQTPELKKEKGTGVGLYTSWRIIQLHGGRIHADSKHKHWAEFRFEIPQPLIWPTDSTE